MVGHRHSVFLGRLVTLLLTADGGKEPRTVAKRSADVEQAGEVVLVNEGLDVGSCLLGECAERGVPARDVN